MFTWLLINLFAGVRPAGEAKQLKAQLPRELALLLAGAGVPTYRQALPQMTAELARARRYDRPLSVALVANGAAPLADGAGAPLAGAGTQPQSPLGPVVLASLLREVMREEDLVSYAATRQRCVVMMPEVAFDQAQQAICRVTAVCTHQFGLPIRAGSATYPTDGWTLDDLVSRAETAETDRISPEPDPASIADAPGPQSRRRNDPLTV